MFYNTINIKGNKLKHAEKVTETQEERILAYFQENTKRRMAPHHILDTVFKDENVPITSIRRAMTNLTSKGKLQKTRYMTRGKYHLRNHTWRLKI